MLTSPVLALDDRHYVNERVNAATVYASLRRVLYVMAMRLPDAETFTMQRLNLTASSRRPLSEPGDIVISAASRRQLSIRFHSVRLRVSEEQECSGADAVFTFFTEEMRCRLFLLKST